MQNYRLRKYENNFEKFGEFIFLNEYYWNTKMNGFG